MDKNKSMNVKSEINTVENVPISLQFFLFCLYVPED